LRQGGDFKTVKNGIEDGTTLEKNKGYDRPLHGYDASRIINGATEELDTHHELESTTNYFKTEPKVTYQGTVVYWDKGKEGVKGSVFYKVIVPPYR
jgi:hypothetical protein